MPPAIKLQHAEDAFVRLSRLDLAWGYLRNGCCPRAHLMARELASMGLASLKAWLFSDDPANMLWIADPLVLGGEIPFGFHVAPSLEIEAGTGSVLHVLDPALFSSPQPVADWIAALHGATARLVVVPFGQAPLPALGGSGYHPGDDPLMGLDSHADESIRFLADLLRQGRGLEYHEIPF